MGRSLARLMAARGDRICLLGRDAEELARSARDLSARGEGRGEGMVSTAPCDLEDPATFGPALDAAAASLGGLDVVVVTAAMFGTQEELEADPARLQRLLAANFSHTILFCEAARAPAGRRRPDDLRVQFDGG